MVDAALAELDAEFSTLYSHTGRPTIPPEQLLKALLLQALFSVRSNRLLVEQINYNILFRWFVGLALDEKVWDHSSFSTNLERLIDAEVSRLFLAKVVAQARKAGLLSHEHFSVDGTLIEAWASIKSFRPKAGPQPPVGRNMERDFHGEKFSNETHASTTDPEARLYKKSKNKESRMSYLGHALMENRNGLIVDGVVTQATGTAEREAAVEMVAEIAGNRLITVGGDKGYDAREYVEELRGLQATPHVAQNTERNGGSAIDGRTTPGMKVTASASVSVSKSRKSSAGSRRSAICARPVIAARRKSIGTLSWPSPLTIWSACGTWELRPAEGAVRPMAHNRPSKGNRGV